MLSKRSKDTPKLLFYLSETKTDTETAIFH